MGRHENVALGPSWTVVIVVQPAHYGYPRSKGYVACTTGTETASTPQRRAGGQPASCWTACGQDGLACAWTKHPFFFRPVLYLRPYDGPTSARGRRLQDDAGSTPADEGDHGPADNEGPRRGPGVGPLAAHAYAP